MQLIIDLNEVVLEKVAETQRKEYALQKSKQMFSRLAKNTWLKIEIAWQLATWEGATQGFGP